MESFENQNKDLDKDNNLKNDFNVDGTVKFDKDTESDPTLISCSGGLLNGAFQVKGGASFGKKVNICGDTKLFSSTASGATNQGALIVVGGVGIGGAANIGGNINVTGTSTLVGEVTVNTGIIPDADEGAYLGSSTKPWSEAHIGEVRIAWDSNDTTIDTATGNLILDSSGGTVQVNDNLTVSGKITASGGMDITGDLRVTGDITAFWSSDETLKDNVTPITDPLAKVLSISGNTFNWNEKSKWEGKADTGVIAQEIEKLGLPGLAVTRDDGTKAVNYEKLTALLIEAVKELSTKVDVLQQSVYMSIDSNTQVNPDK